MARFDNQQFAPSTLVPDELRKRGVHISAC